MYMKRDNRTLLSEMRTPYYSGCFILAVCMYVRRGEDSIWWERYTVSYIHACSAHSFRNIIHVD